ncbi:MAG: AcrR family transcriptional regulator [Spirochaetae bacterium HGW-Spirochaetae-1]|jgi:AcrR family transcriptional regulator|nr:MAG: AcrR family transcriptional regulator [Spirochaetae bacterium HGW-Spirochaetae-1]
MNEKRHKETFDKISDEKRGRILQAATKEFAEKGFSAANINVIAKNAGISIGSMYNYFASKEDLFLTVFDQGYKLLEKALVEVSVMEGDIFDKFESLIRVAQKSSRQYRELTQIYLDITSEGLTYLQQRLSRDFESITAKYYRDMINKAKNDGLVDQSIDEFVFSFCLDNLIVLLQFSYASEYFKERMKIFAGEDSLENDEKMIKGIMHFIRGALAPRK